MEHGSFTKTDFSVDLDQEEYVESLEEIPIRRSDSRTDDHPVTDSEKTMLSCCARFNAQSTADGALVGSCGRGN